MHWNIDELISCIEQTEIPFNFFRIKCICVWLILVEIRSNWIVHGVAVVAWGRGWQKGRRPQLIHLSSLMSNKVNPKSYLIVHSWSNCLLIHIMMHGIVFISNMLLARHINRPSWWSSCNKNWNWYGKKHNNFEITE